MPPEGKVCIEKEFVELNDNDKKKLNFYEETNVDFVQLPPEEYENEDEEKILLEESKV